MLELSKLLKLRRALVALKGLLGNLPDFRKSVSEALKDENTKKQLLLEIDAESKESKERNYKKD